MKRVQLNTAVINYGNNPKRKENVYMRNAENRGNVSGQIVNIYKMICFMEPSTCI